uniref:G_PROTEIN_RECEP_F1_2 domain-containing protein n=1 Tax=Haemonchus contortus TaxID=6289 RepID=A0A7I4Y0A4_HAECO
MRRECTFEPSSYNILLSVIFFCVFTLSLMGNFLVIFTILSKTHRTRSITNFYLLNLAVADLLRSVVCMPLTLLSELTRCWLLGRMMCKTVAFLQPVGVCASAYTLAVIAVERYYAICRPLQSRKWKTKKRALITISMVWLFSFICNIGSLFIFDNVPFGNHWNCDTTKGPLIDFFYQLYVTLVLLFIPLCAMVSLYGHVIYALSTVIVSDNSVDPVVQQSIMQELPLCTSTFSEWLYASVGIPTINGNNNKEKQQSLSIPSSDKLSVRPRSRLSSINTLFGTPRSSFDSTMLLRSTNQEKILCAKKKVTRMLMTIVAAFAVCWLPNYLWWLLVRASDLAGTPIWHSGLNMALTILTYISSTTNPVTYCFMNKGFRTSVLSYFTRRKKSRHRSVQHSRRSPPPNEAARDVANTIPLIKIDLVESAIHM